MASIPGQQPNTPSASGQQPVANQLALLALKRQQTAHQPTTRSSPHPPVGQHHKGMSGKTFWDWLQLLTQVIGAFAIPISIIALFISVIQFNQQQINNTRLASAQQQHDAQQTLDQQQQITLETYLDHMSDLLLTNKLNESKAGDEERAVARARTLAALQNLNPVRKGILLQFLYEARLIDIPQVGRNFPLVDIRDADLGKALLERFVLEYAELYQVNLSMADLFHAKLFEADLSFANLSGANLNHADLIKTKLIYTKLLGADLRGADLRDADLSGADLRGVDLRDADLSGADLRGTIINQSQLDQVTLCLGATLPKGIICPQWA